MFEQTFPDARVETRKPAAVAASLAQVRHGGSGFKYFRWYYRSKPSVCNGRNRKTRCSVDLASCNGAGLMTRSAHNVFAAEPPQ